MFQDKEQSHCYFKIVGLSMSLVGLLRAKNDSTVEFWGLDFSLICHNVSPQVAKHS